MGTRARWSNPDDRTWLELSARLTKAAHRISGRTDVVVEIHPGTAPTAGRGGYLPERATVVIAADEVLQRNVDDPRVVDVASDHARARWWKLYAALIDHALHARHTPGAWPSHPASQTRRWAEVLDDQRIWAAGVRHRPATRVWLRQRLSELIARDRDHLKYPHADIVVLGARAAGVLEPGEVTRVRHSLLMTLGISTFGRVEAILRQAIALGDDDVAEMLNLGAALSRLVDDASDGQGGRSTLAEDAARVVGTQARAVVDAPRSTGDDPQRQSERQTREYAARANQRVFQRQSEPPPNVTRHAPNTAQQRRARALARQLRTAAVADPELRGVSQLVPPGRLRSGELMRRDAQVAARAPITARPWLLTRRHTPKSPKMAIGLSWDTSRSQSALHPVLCEFAWALAHAVSATGGQMAAVGWNNRASAVTWPGRRPLEIVEPPCGGGSRGCPDSLRALSGALAWHRSDQPRVLIVMTDARVPNARMVDDEVAALMAAGVMVLWVTDHPDHWCPRGVHVIVTRPDSLIEDVGVRLAAMVKQWGHDRPPQYASGSICCDDERREEPSASHER